MGPADLDRAGVDGLRADLADLDERLRPLRLTLAGDPIVGLARALPVSSTQVAAADDLVAAADALLEAGDLGLDLAERVVSLQESEAADPSTSVVSGMVELMATSTSQVDRIAELVDVAMSRLAGIPPEALGQIREARDLVAGPLDSYRSLLEAYQALDDVAPGVLGWGGERRYLVLAQNPAELRPAGGYSGTVGIIAFRDGRVVEQRFTDVHKLDGQEGLPFVEAPPPLRDHLLGETQSWRLGDAAWAADFPTAARKALELYEMETGDTDVDGVIALTTFALDRLMEVIGPVTVEAYDVTVQPGEATLTLLGETRWTEETAETRKEILDALARTAMARLMGLAPEQWPAMVEALDDIGEQRMALAWFRDAEAQRLALSSGWAGQVRQEAGDYLYVVEANMAPTSKYNLVVDRSDSLVVKLDEAGDALTSLRLDWLNNSGRRGEPYRSLRAYSFNTAGLYGAYVRVLVPAGTELLTARGQAAEDVGVAEALPPEAGREAFGTYLLMPPGEAMMSYLWTTPGAAREEAGTWEYRLTVQRQPGAGAHDLTVRVDLPDGARVVEATEGADVTDGRVRLEASLLSDVVLRVVYSLRAEAAA